MPSRLLQLVVADSRKNTALPLPRSTTLIIIADYLLLAGIIAAFVIL